jgi:glycosyltransferase 2 family protein
VLIGYMFNLAFPRLGEVSKCTVMNRYEKIPLDKLIGTIIVERAFDTLCLLLIMFLTVVSQFNLLFNFFLDMVYNPLSTKLSHISGVLIAIVIGVFMAAVVVGFILFKKMLQAGKFSKLTQMISGVLDGVKSIFKMEKKALFLLYTVLLWLSYWYGQHLGFYAIEQLSSLGFGASWSCMSFGSLGVIATQGGIGAYHKIVIEVLKLYHITEDYSFAYSWIVWGTGNLLIVMAGLTSLILLPILNRKATS